VIPIMKDCDLEGYFERDAERVRAVEIGDLLSDGTTLVKVVDIPARADLLFSPDSPTY